MARSTGHIGKVLELLDARERVRLGFVILCAIILAVIDVIGVGTIMPFIAVASKPYIIRENAYLAWAYSTFGFQSTQAFLIFLGIGMLAFLVVRNMSQAFMHYVKIRFTSMRRYTISSRLFNAYLSQEYPFFLNRNSYEFIKNINSEIEHMISGTLMQLVDFIAYFFQVLLLVVFLFIVNPMSTLAITVTIILLYGCIYFFIRKKLKRLGTERFTYNLERNRIVSEAFWGIKEVKITGIEKIFADAYRVPAKKLAKNASTQELLGDLPKYALETVAFGAIIVFIMSMIIQNDDFQQAMATISVYAYGGYRLIPAIQNLFKAITKLKYGAPSAERIVEEFRVTAQGGKRIKLEKNRLPFSSGIKLDNVTFTYPSTDKPVLKSISLDIAANSLVGFAGKTGSGKTTLIDIFLGLLKPDSGAIVVDGTPVTADNVGKWQKNLGYVPQNIYLSNSTITSNIAYGVPPEQIDMEAVKDAARLAQIHDFIESELKEGYDTKIGERGIRLSGGQRQRIGIARALYRKPSILVVDEATSALDNQTENAVMEAIDSLAGKKTIILIAHRLTTLRKCDMIYCLENGEIARRGTYDEVFRE